MKENLKLKDNFNRVIEESQYKKSLNFFDTKESSNLNINKNFQKEFILSENQIINTNNKEIRGRITNCTPSENIFSQNNLISSSKDLFNFNNSLPNEITYNLNKSKESGGNTLFERTNSIDNDKRNTITNKNGLKIPINMNNIHSFNINVITQTVSNQVNNFISNLNSNVTYLNSDKGSSNSSLINLNSNTNINLINNNLIPIKKKK